MSDFEAPAARAGLKALAGKTVKWLRSAFPRVELSWLILEELFDPGSRAARTTLAVVDDNKHGWRVNIAKSEVSDG